MNDKDQISQRMINIVLPSAHCMICIYDLQIIVDDLRDRVSLVEYNPYWFVCLA